MAKYFLTLIERLVTGLFLLEDFFAEVLDFLLALIFLLIFFLALDALDLGTLFFLVTGVSFLLIL